MKNKFFLTLLAIMALTLLFAVSSFAAEPNVNGETVTLKDGTVIPIWDTDGDALIWYKSDANAEDGYEAYDYIKAQASEVDYKTSWAGGIAGVYANQVSTVTITVGGNTYGNGDIVVFNIKDEDVVVTTSAHGSVGKSINCISGIFQSSKNVEFVFLKLDTVAIQGSAFSHCSTIRYVNLEELTELRQIISQNFTNCSSFFDGETLDLSKTKLTNINSGTFNNTPIGAIIFPESLVRLENWSLQGLLKIKEIHIPETITFFGNTVFKNCYELEKVTGFKALFERGVLTDIPGATFLDCRALVSVDLPDTYGSIGTHAFQGTSSLSGVFRMPSECTSIGVNVFHSTGLETIILSPNITKIPEYAFCASAVKYVYIPAGVTSIDKEAFRNVTNKMVIYYTGTDPEVLKSITVNNYNGVILDKTSIYVSADEFDLESRENQHYVVYGYDHCKAFYGDHSWIGEENIAFPIDYFKQIEIVDTCATCGGTSTIKAIGPIFSWRGYSCSTFGETFSVAQCFYVDSKAIDEYALYSPDFDYGVLATGNASGEAITPKLGDEKVHTGKFVKDANDYIVIKVTGITKELFNTNIVFCAYVIDNTEMYYLDGGTTASSVIGISYNGILG